MDRERYAGPVGWMDAEGNGEWGIALRCAQIAGNRARLFAGGGIVAGSDPAAELAETQVKIQANAKRRWSRRTYPVLSVLVRSLNE